MDGLEQSEKAGPRPNQIRRTQCHLWRSATIGVTVGVIVIVGVMGPAAFLTALSRVTCPIQYRVSGDCVILGPPPARFDQQAVLFEPTTVRSLSTNVTFSEISDGDGYGPAYLLNGLTNEGFWFQIGTAYNWSIQSGGYTAGPGVIYAEFSPKSSPNSPAQIRFVPAQIGLGDKVHLSLGFSGGRVVLCATDAQRSYQFSKSFDAMGASVFLGTRGASPPAAFFSGWMTEWRHGSEYMGPTAWADYSLQPPIAQIYVGFDEWTPADGQIQFDCAALENLSGMIGYDFHGEGMQVSVNETSFVSQPPLTTGAIDEEMACSAF